MKTANISLNVQAVQSRGMDKSCLLYTSWRDRHQKDTEGPPLLWMRKLSGM